MAGPDDIVQNIVLQGQDDIKNAFASIEQAGTHMFAQLQQAASGNSIQKFAIEIGAAIGAVTAITAAIFGWAQSAANSTVELGRLADAGGSSIENMSSLVQALNVDTQALEGSFRRMAVRIESEWPQIQKAQQNAADVIIANNVAIQQSLIAVERAQQAAANAARDVAQAQVANANTVKGATISLAEAIERQRVAEGGTADPAKDQALARQRASLAVAQARLQVQQAEQKAAQDAADAQNAIAQKQLEAQQAQLKLAADIKKAREDEMNDINNLAKFVDNLAKGTTDATLKVNVTADNVVKGLIASMGSAGAALKAVGGDIRDLSNQPPTVVAAFLKLADVFKNTEDAALKTAVAVNFFGRGIGQDMVEKLNKGSAAILQQQQHLKDLGLVITEDNRLIGKDLKDSVNQLGDVLDIISKKSALAFAPLQTGVLKTLTQFLENNNKAFIGFAQTIEQKVTPVIAGLVGALTGIDISKTLDISDTGKKATESWQKTFEVLVNTVKFAMGVIVGVLDLAAQNLNSFLKTDLSAMDVGLALLALRFGGLLGIIIVLGVTLDKLTGGGIIGWLQTLGSAISEAAVQFNLLGLLIERRINWETFKKGIDESNERFKAVMASNSDAAKKSQEAITANADKAAAAVLAAQEKITAGIKAGLAAQDAARKAAGQQPTGEPSAPGVPAITPTAGTTKAVQDQISLFDQLGKTIKVVTVGGAEGFDKLAGASKSFGQQMIDSQDKIIKSFDQLDKELGEINIVEDLTKGTEGKDVGAAIVEQVAVPLEEVKTKSADIWEQIFGKWSQSPINPENWTLGSKFTTLQVDIFKATGKAYDDIKTQWDKSPINPGNWTESGIATFFSGLLTSSTEKYGEIKAGWTPTPITTDGWAAPIEAFFASAVAMATTAKAKIDAIMSAPIPQPSGGGVGDFGGEIGGGFDEGGYFRGKPGRDTNLAWLTDKEFIHSPESTQFWGVGLHSWMNSIARSGRVDLAQTFRSLLGGLGRFRDGGLNTFARAIANPLPRLAQAIAAPIPAFAGGGLNQAWSSVDARGGGGGGAPNLGTLRLAFPNGREIGTLTGQRSAIDQLIRESTKDQATRLAPPSSWNR